MDDDQVKIKTSNGSGDINIDILKYDPDVASSYPGVASYPEVASDPLVKHIKEILETKSVSSSRCSIYKVPKCLRSMNPEAYTPQVISIGPYHHGKEDLKAMELHKLSFLQSFFRRTNLNPVIVIEKVRSWEKQARECYAEPINMNSDEFVKLILVDGCFLLEFFIRRSSISHGFLRLILGDDEIVRLILGDDEIDYLIDGNLGNYLMSDLIMLENQLPFFVLHGLSQLYSETEDISISELIRSSFPFIYKNQKEFTSEVSGHNIENHLVNELWRYFIPDTKRIYKHSSSYSRPPTATQLYEAGVVFKIAERKLLGDVITGITFKNGVLEIPHIHIYDSFETYLRNLIAFEQCHHVEYYVTHFALFMDGLINTDRDVSLLIKRGIISNHLGNDEDVSKLFNNLCKQIDSSGKRYYYDVCDEIQKYCGARRHRWIASLRRDYFNTPWAFMSFSAAVVLLLLTLIQTIFSGLAINK